MTAPRFQRTKIKPKSYADYLQDKVDRGEMTLAQKKEYTLQAKLGYPFYNKNFFK